jgi:hypothetical protein
MKLGGPDKLSARFIRCPECDEWRHSRPTEGVPEQSLRTCDGCGSDFLIDWETTQMLDELNFVQVDGEEFAVEDAAYLESSNMIESCPYSECEHDYHILPQYCSADLRGALRRALVAV